VNKVLAEMNEDYLIGFKTPECQLDMLSKFSNVDSKHATKQEKWFAFEENTDRSFEQELIPKAIYILASIYHQR